jgi:hypothetical protein
MPLRNKPLHAVVSAILVGATAACGSNPGHAASADLPSPSAQASTAATPAPAVLRASLPGESVDCAVATHTLEVAAPRPAHLPSASRPVLLGDHFDRVVALRVDGNAASDSPYFYSSEDGLPVPKSVDVDPNATSALVRAIVRRADACKAVSLEIDLDQRAIAVNLALQNDGAVLQQVEAPYALRLHDIEERIDELKEHVWRSDARPLARVSPSPR